MSAKAKRRRIVRKASTNSQIRDAWESGRWWFVGGGIAALGILIMVLLSAAFSRTGGDSLFDFPVSLYQGEQIAGGDEISFSELLGNKPIVLNYWASNCAPCSAEMPHFEQVWSKYSDQVVFFGLDVGLFSGFGGPEESVAELNRLGITYPAGPVPDIEVVRRLNVRGLPSTDFITPDGEIIRNWIGVLNEEKLTELVEDLLKVS